MLHTVMYYGIIHLFLKYKKKNPAVLETIRYIIFKTQGRHYHNCKKIYI